MYFSTWRNTGLTYNAAKMLRECGISSFSFLSTFAIIFKGVYYKYYRIFLNEKDSAVSIGIFRRLAVITVYSLILSNILAVLQLVMLSL